MRIFDETKTQELNADYIDHKKGYLKPDKLFVAHHEAVEAKEAVYQDRVEHLSNGSTQVWKDLVTPAVEAKEAYDEYEDIQIFIPYTEAELKERVERKELADLEKWFTEVYDAQVKQYNRCQRLGIAYDNKYGTIAELDNQATTNAKRISELRSKHSAK